MRLIPAKVSFPLVGGIDTKSDTKSIPPTKLTTLENGEFTKRGSIRKRPGLAALSTQQLEPITSGGLFRQITAGESLASLRNDLVLLGHAGETNDPSTANLFTYAAELDRWNASNTRLTRARVTAVPGPFSTVEQAFGDTLVTSGLAFDAWEEGTGLRIQVATADGSRLLLSDELIPTARSARWVLLGDTVLLFYANTSANDLLVRRFPVADVLHGFFVASATVTSTLNATSVFDVRATTSMAGLVTWHSDANELRTGIFDSAGTITLAATVNTVTNIVAVSGVAHPTTNRVGVCLYTTTGPRATAYLLEGTSLSTLATADILDEAGAAIASGTKITIGVQDEADFIVLVERSAASNSNFSVNWRELDINNWTTGNTTRLRHSHLASHAFSGKTGAVHCWLGFDSTLQSSSFLYTFIAGFDEFTGRALPLRAGGVLSRAHLPGANTGPDGVITTALGLRRRLKLDGAISANQLASFFEHRGFERVSVEITWQISTAEVGRALYAANGVLNTFDGTHAVESGFVLFPEGITSANQGAGNLTANAVYNYRVFYEWYNSAGERQRSLAIPIQHTVSGSNQIVRLTVPTLTHTKKRLVSGVGPTPVAIVVYRTEANKSQLFYRVSSNNPTAVGNNGWVTNSQSVDTVTFDDNLSDTNIRAREIDYLSDDPQPLPNAAPESGDTILAAQTRLFLAGGALPKSTLQFSKLRADGEPVEFVSEFILTVPEEGGAIVALGEINGTIVVFKRDRIYSLIGTGPDNTGLGDPYLVQHVTSDTGCINQHSVVQIPNGLMFQGTKGIYVLDQALNVSYIGADVEAFNQQTITSAQVIPDTNQVVFLVEDGQTLMFDYFYGQWSSWRGEFNGVSATTTEAGDYVLLKADGRCLRRDINLFNDGGSPYNLHIETAPIRLQESVLGFYKIRRVQVIGEFRSPHRLQVGLTYNRDLGPFQVLVVDPDAGIITTEVYATGAVFGDTVETYGGELNGSEYLFEFRPKRSKCSTIRFDFRDLISGEAGASYEISEILLDCYNLDDPAKVGAVRKI